MDIKLATKKASGNVKVKLGNTVNNKRMVKSGKRELRETKYIETINTLNKKIKFMSK